ncbi:MAG: copper chaperone PCu(A)C [Bauldia sp.]|nr:copper chaperone PCu(A)C [Bauldia sp.]
MSFRTLVAAAAVALAFTAQALAHDVTVGTLTLTDLWTRATPPSAPAGGGFLTITNNGDEPDRLIAVSAPGVKIGEVHEMAVKDGVMTMRPLENGLEIPAHGSVTLAPGGFHLMFIGIEKPFVEGEKLPVTLTFANAGSIDTFLHIEPIGSKGPAAGGAHQMDMQPDMKMDMNQ